MNLTKKPEKARKTGHKARLATLLLALLASVGALFLAEPTALATTDPGVNATPFNEGGEWWTTDGCTAVPDSGNEIGGPFDFHHACMHHDGCYRYHWSDRATCDQWFLNDMFASCAALRSYLGCYVRATLYYRGSANSAGSRGTTTTSL